MVLFQKLNQALLPVTLIENGTRNPQGEELKIARVAVWISFWNAVTVLSSKEVNSDCPDLRG